MISYKYRYLKKNKFFPLYFSGIFSPPSQFSICKRSERTYFHFFVFLDLPLLYFDTLKKQAYGDILYRRKRCLLGLQFNLVHLRSDISHVSCLNFSYLNSSTSGRQIQ